MGLTPVKEDTEEDAFQRVIYNDVAHGGAAWSQHKKWQHGQKQPRLMRQWETVETAPAQVEVRVKVPAAHCGRDIAPPLMGERISGKSKTLKG